MRARFAAGAFGFRIARLMARGYPGGRRRVLSGIDSSVNFPQKGECGA
jgi:hypothetical protein